MANFAAKVHKNGPDELVVESGGKITVNSGGLIQKIVTKVVNGGWRAGAGAGWTTTGDTPSAKLPASQSASTLVVPIPCKVGDVITSFKVIAQIESAGGTVTLDAALRKTTNAAADPTDAAIGAGITQVSVIADTAVAAEKTGLSETVAEDECIYALITGTTAASTDIQLQSINVTLQEQA